MARHPNRDLETRDSIITHNARLLCKNSGSPHPTVGQCLRACHLKSGLVQQFLIPRTNSPNWQQQPTPSATTQILPRQSQSTPTIRLVRRICPELLNSPLHFMADGPECRFAAWVRSCTRSTRTSYRLTADNLGLNIMKLDIAGSTAATP